MSRQNWNRPGSSGGNRSQDDFQRNGQRGPPRHVNEYQRGANQWHQNRPGNGQQQQRNYQQQGRPQNGGYQQQGYDTGSDRRSSYGRGQAPEDFFMPPPPIPPSMLTGEISPIHNRQFNNRSGGSYNGSRDSRGRDNSRGDRDFRDFNESNRRSNDRSRDFNDRSREPIDSRDFNDSRQSWRSDGGRKRRHDEVDNEEYGAPRSRDNSSYRNDSRGSQRYQRPVPEKPEKFKIDFKSHDECTDEELRYYLNLTEDEVPIYIMRMRKLGPTGYPPALIDDAARVSSTLPFMGDPEQIFTKRSIKAEDLKPFRGFTHVEGESVSTQFAEFMQKVADRDYQNSHDHAVRRAKRSGLSMEGPILIEEEEKVPMEPVNFDVPNYELSFDEGYAFGDTTKGMKHELEAFRAGIQPFVASEPNAPSYFMEKLRSIMKKDPLSVSNGDVEKPNGSQTGVYEEGNST